MDKAAEAFRTISEVAQVLDVPQHVLRFWETRFSQIKPMKRGGGRRYYRPGDVDLLKGIRHLLYDKGYTIRGVQRILREHGNAHVAAIGRGEVAAVEEEDVAGEGGPVPAVPGERAAAAGGGAPLTLTPQQVADLELSLADLAAAHRLLAGAVKAQGSIQREE
jgi:DNA-binding transcriptional MerR regulator